MFNDKFQNIFKQFESCLNNLLECENNCAESCVMELNLFKIFKVLSDLEVVINAVEMKFLQQRIRVGEFAKLGGVPRMELELLFNYERFTETIDNEVKRAIGSQLQKLHNCELDGNVHFHFMFSKF